MNAIIGLGLSLSRFGNDIRRRSAARAAALFALVLLLSFGAIPASAQCTLSSPYTWTDGNGNWSNASSWSPSGGPPNSATANACITDGSSAVLLNTSETVANLQLGYGNTLKVYDSNGTGISLTAGTITNSGNFNFYWTGMGTGSGNTVATSGDFTNTGTAFVNMNGSGDSLTVGGNFNNSGTINLTTGSPSYQYYSETLSVAGNFNNTSGTVSFDSNSVFNQATVNGNFTNANSSSWVVMIGSEDTLNVNGSFSNSGLVVLGGSLEMLSVNGANGFTNNSTVLLTGYGDALTVANGTFTNNGTLTLNQGVASTTYAGNSFGANALTNNGTITLSNNDELLGVNADLTNSGTITLDSTSNGSEVFGGGTFYNNPSASLNMNGTNDVLSFNDIENSGAITLNGMNEQISVGPGGTPASTTPYAFNNYSGASLTLSTDCSGSSAASTCNVPTVYVTGAFNNYFNANVTMTGANDSLDAASFTNSGNFILNGTGEVVEGNTSATGFTNNSTGIVTFGANSIGSYLYMPGQFTNNGMVTMGGNGDELAVSQMTNSGTITMAGNQEVLYSYGVNDFTNGGMLQFTSASNGSQVSVSGQFNNQSGAMLIMAGTNDLLTTTGVGYFTNSGMVSVGATETLNASGYGYNNGGTTTVAGILNTPSYQQFSGSATTVQTGGTINATSNYLEYGGILTIDSGAAVHTGNYMNSGGTLIIQTGGILDPTTVTISGGAVQGTGLIIGNVTNSGGTITPGAPGTPGMFTIHGNYAQGPDGILDIYLAGTGSGQYSVLNVSGQAMLGGTLDLIATNGFDPAAGEDFNFLLAGSESGDFSSVVLTGWSCPTGDTCSGSFSDGIYSFDVMPSVSTPEPGEFLLLATALIGLAAFWRSKGRRAWR